MTDHINDRTMVGAHSLVSRAFPYEGGRLPVIGSDLCLTHKVVHGNGKFRSMLVTEVGEGA